MFMCENNSVNSMEFMEFLKLALGRQSCCTVPREQSLRGAVHSTKTKHGFLFAMNIGIDGLTSGVPLVFKQNNREHTSFVSLDLRFAHPPGI